MTQAPKKVAGTFKRFSKVNRIEVAEFDGITIADPKKQTKEFAEVISSHLGNLERVAAPDKASELIAKELPALKAVASAIAKPEMHRQAPVAIGYRPEKTKTEKTQRRMHNSTDTLRAKTALKKQRALSVPEQIAAMIQKERELTISIAKKKAKLLPHLTGPETVLIVNSINNLIRCRRVLKQRVRNMIDHLESKGRELIG